MIVGLNMVDIGTIKQGSPRRAENSDDWNCMHLTREKYYFVCAIGAICDGLVCSIAQRHR